jgi:outer membrane protein OmpA-like peptidoglycan-associated protein
MVLGCLSATAQNEAPKTEKVFNPHWYIQAQYGGQYTLGEISFNDLVSQNAQLGVGYNFTKIFGARLSVNAWQSKGGIACGSVDAKWKWNYVAPMVDVTMNLSNLICGFNPDRLVNVSIFGGIGANIGFNNDEANDLAANGYYLVQYGYQNSLSQNLAYNWDGTKVRFTGRFGANIDFRISDAVSVGLEANANVLNDHYNSKKAGNGDWYFNGLIGVKYNFGKTYTTREIPCCKPQIVERVVEKIVEKPVEVIKEVEKAPAKETLRRDIFYTISSVQVPSGEQSKIAEVAEYLKKYPEAKVTVTGYADKGTGNTAINERLASNRANTVVRELVNKYGISKSRIISSSKGDSEQPYSENEKNRVAICIAE